MDKQLNNNNNNNSVEKSNVAILLVFPFLLFLGIININYIKIINKNILKRLFHLTYHYNYESTFGARHNLISPSDATIYSIISG